MGREGIWVCRFVCLRMECGGKGKEDLGGFDHRGLGMRVAFLVDVDLGGGYGGIGMYNIHGEWRFMP